MTLRQQALLDALIAAGWELAQTQELPEWWADDVWLMRSIWSPEGRQFYLTFLVDPQADRQRKRGEMVWAVKASATLPTGWQQADGGYVQFGPRLGGAIKWLYFRCITIQAGPHGNDRTEFR